MPGQEAEPWKTTPHWLGSKRARRYAWATLLLTLFTLSSYLFRHFATAVGQVDIDFIAFHAAGQLAWQGHPATAYILEHLHAQALRSWPDASTYLWLYPPTFFFAVAPLANMPPLLAYALFMSLTLGIYLVAARQLARSGWVLLPALAFPAVLINALYGQNALLTAGLLMLGLAALRSQRPRQAGTWLGLLTLKPHLSLAVPLALLAGRHYLALCWAGLSATALFLLSLLIWGADSWAAFFDGLSKAKLALEDGQLPWHRMISVFASVRSLGGSVTLAYSLHAILALCCVLLLISTWRRSQDPALRNTMLVLTTLTLSPYQYDYDLAWLAPALILLCQRGLASGWLRGERELLALIWIFPLLDLLVLNPLFKPNLFVLPECLLLAMTWRKLRTAHPERSAQGSQA